MAQSIKKIIKAAKAGGAVLRTYFGKSLETVQKTMAADFRTKADLDSEETILKIFAKEFPDYNIYSEELGEKKKGSEYTLIIDPLDGTNNFVLGLPNFSVSIGLLKNDEIVTGAIYLPFMDQTYWAEKGNGAFRDSVKLKVNSESDIKKSSVSITCGYTSAYGFSDSLIKKLNDRLLKRFLVNWSPAYDFCLLASGKIEAVVSHNLDIYDYVAGKLIATEAGVLITDFSGKSCPDKEGIFIASNGSALHQELVKVIASVSL